MLQNETFKPKTCPLLPLTDPVQKTNCKQTVFDLSSFLIPFCSDVQQWLNPTLISVPSYLIGCLNRPSETCFSDSTKSIFVFVWVIFKSSSLLCSKVMNCHDPIVTFIGKVIELFRLTADSLVLRNGWRSSGLVIRKFISYHHCALEHLTLDYATVFSVL